MSSVAGGDMPESLARGELARALRAECSALDDLRQGLLRQRSGVASNDVQSIEDSIQAIGRILLKLDEAQRHRKDVLGRVTGEPEMPLDQLEEALGGLPGPLADVMEEMRVAGMAVGQDLAINQHILRRALDSGESFLQQLFAGAVPPGNTYGCAAAERASGAGVILNRTV